MTRLLFTSAELDARDTRMTRTGWLRGVGVGVFLGGCAMSLIAWLVGFGLDTYRLSLYQRDIKAAVNVGNECMELWNVTQPESYASAVETMRQIKAKREGRQ